MSEALKQAVAEAARQAASSMTSRIRSMAVEASWPDRAVQALSVVEADGDLEIKIDPEDATMVEALEYGTSSTPPNSVIRRFKADIPVLMAPYITAAISSNVDQIVEDL